MRTLKGFTLIELLVVISIIGLLSSVVLASLGSARQKSRDSVRLSDMRQIRLALDMYHTANSRYPGWVHNYGESSPTCGGWDTSRGDEDGDGKFFIEPLKDDGLMAVVPRDPLDSSSQANCGGYDYHLYSAGSYNCDASKGDYFVLGVRDMEASNNPHPSSPGWSCPSRDWQVEFDWVVGGFTR